ncbi:hypothetical protein HWV62_43565 [Athelia sp. TMB]|nr:hypothetical protein HWV62_43565 [Athelia sp. TMB]
MQPRAVREHAISADKKDIGAMSSGRNTPVSRGSKRGRGSTRARGGRSGSKRGGKTKKGAFGAPDD